MNFLTRWYKRYANIRFDAAFEERFRLELAKTELLRINLLLGALTFGLVAGIINIVLMHEAAVYMLLLPAVGFLILNITAFVVYEWMARRYIFRCVNERKPIPRTFRIVNALVETSFPTLVIITFILRVDNIIVLFSPFVLLYFLFIVLSTLHLDLWLCILTGAVAAIEYLIVSEIIVHVVPIPQDVYVLLSAPTIIVARCLLIFLCGVASGFVAVEIKRRVLSTSRALNERNQIRQIFGQQVSHEIVDQILLKGKEMKTERVNVCVMFLDVRDFTPFASQHTPEEVLDYQNKLFGSLIDIVNKYSGIINQILGDGFMATFGAPISRGNDCSNAVKASLEILDWTQKACDEGIIHPTRLGIGIHYGEVITGNIGTELRKQFSIVGNVVISASRIEQLNKDFKSELLISKEVFNQITGDGSIKGESLGDVMLKGESKPMEIIKIR